jgi:hypothetical protein
MRSRKPVARSKERVSDEREDNSRDRLNDFGGEMAAVRILFEPEPAIQLCGSGTRQQPSLAKSAAKLDLCALGGRQHLLRFQRVAAISQCLGAFQAKKQLWRRHFCAPDFGD